VFRKRRCVRVKNREDVEKLREYNLTFPRHNRDGSMYIYTEYCICFSRIQFVKQHFTKGPNLGFTYSLSLAFFF
jgi:hypothetical protein